MSVWEKSDKMKYAREKVKQARDDSPTRVRFSDDTENCRTRHIYVSGILVPFETGLQVFLRSNAPPSFLFGAS